MNCNRVSPELQMPQGHKYFLEAILDAGERLAYRGSRWPLFDIRLDTVIMVHHGGQQEISGKDATFVSKRRHETHVKKINERKMSEGYVFSSSAMENDELDGAQFLQNNSAVSTTARLGWDGDPLRLSGLNTNRPAKSMILKFDSKSQFDDAGVLEGVKFTNYMCKLIREASDTTTESGGASAKRYEHVRREVSLH